MLLRLHLPKKQLKKVEANHFCPKKSNPMEEPAKIVGCGREAFSGGKMLPSHVFTSSILEELPKCLWQSWEKMLLSRLGIGFLGSTGISKLFSRRDKKKLSFRQHKMILSTCLPKMQNVKKTLGFQRVILRKRTKKDVEFADSPVELN